MDEFVHFFMGEFVHSFTPQDQAGAQHSQSPIKADGETVVGKSLTSASQLSGQYCSLGKLS
jgi:hypothetical protein